MRYQEELLADDIRAFNTRLLTCLGKYNTKRPHHALNTRNSPELGGNIHFLDTFDSRRYTPPRLIIQAPGATENWHIENSAAEKSLPIFEADK